MYAQGSFLLEVMYYFLNISLLPLPCENHMVPPLSFIFSRIPVLIMHSNKFVLGSEGVAEW